MTFLKNIKIRSKLILGFGLLIVIAITTSVFGIVSLNTNSTNVSIFQQYATARYNNLLEIEARFNNVRRIVATMSFHGAEEAALSALRGEAFLQLDTIGVLLNANQESLHAEPGLDEGLRTLFLGQKSDLQSMLDTFRTAVVDSMFNAAMLVVPGSPAGRVTLERVFERGEEYATHVESSFAALSTSTTNAINEQIGHMEDSNSRTVTILAVLMALGIVFGVIVTFTISGSVGKPIRKLVTLVEDVVEGNLNVNMDKSELGKDEVGVLIHDVYELVETIKNINDEITKFTKVIGDEGDYEYRIDYDKYKGAYGGLLKGVNNAVDASAQDSAVMLGALSELSQGKFDIVTKRLPGKRAAVNESLDKFIELLNNVVDGINYMVDMASDKGKMDFKIPEEGFEGGWYTMIRGLNDVGRAVDGPLHEIRTVMANLADGKFDKKIWARGYKGDFLAIQKSVNYTVKTLYTYVDEISDNLAAIAAGDLSNTIKAKYIGDFLPIKEAINEIIDKWNRAITDITVASNNVLEGAGSISQNAMVLSDGSSSQAASLEELHTTVELINRQTEKFATNAKDANELSNRSTENANKGSEAMRQMFDSMLGIKESSESISSINQVIQNIAFQTNLLALNASVEAARAGEHGRGFSVVADEVRSLASRSQDAASETTGLISDSMLKVESGVSIAQATSDSLETIVTSAAEVMELINNITEDAAEQAAMIAQISDTLLHTATTVQDNSKFAQDAAATAEELSSQSEKLSELVSYFKLMQ